MTAQCDEGPVLRGAGPFLFLIEAARARRFLGKERKGALAPLSATGFSRCSSSVEDQSSERDGEGDGEGALPLPRAASRVGEQCP